MDFLRYVYRIHGVFGFIIGLGAIALLGYWLMPSHPLTEVRTWVAFAGWVLGVFWYSIGWECFKHDCKRNTPIAAKG